MDGVAVGGRALALWPDAGQYLLCGLRRPTDVSTPNMDLQRDEFPDQDVFQPMDGASHVSCPTTDVSSPGGRGPVHQSLDEILDGIQQPDLFVPDVPEIGHGSQRHDGVFSRNTVGDCQLSRDS